MSFRTSWKRCSMLFAVFIWCATSATTSFASSPGGGVDDDAVFELDGNAVNDAAPGDDWGNALAYPGHPAAGSALAQTWVVDLTNTTSDNEFTGGGSKDTLGIQSGAWLWNTSKPQAKDDIAHAFAAAYTLPGSGDTAIYFGMDRFDNSGAATAGFWFFQDSTVGLSNTKQGGGFRFTGQHMDGDLLIVADFSIGGGASAIQVYKWVGDDATGTLVLQSVPDKDCNATTGTSELCGIVNTGNAVSPWGFLNKSGQTFFAHGELLEGGIDLNAVFGANIPCFTTFMAETRSSNSPTASLSDFSPPASFPLCGISVAKGCNGGGVISNGGNMVSYSWTVTANNTGIGNLYDVTVLDTLPDGVKVNVPLINESTTPNFLAGKSSVSGTVTFTVTCSNGVCTGAEPGGKTVANPLSVTNTADVQAFTAPNSGGTKIIPKPDVPQTATCQASAPGAITVVKHCDATNGGPILVSQGGFVVVEVPFTADIKNTTTPGTGEAVNNITLTDVPAATFTSNGTISSLAPGQTVTAKGFYFPSAVDSAPTPLGLAAGRYFFTDTLTATGTGAIGGEVVSNQGAVSCPICPQGECDGPLP
jgi:hypothetical protein